MRGEGQLLSLLLHVLDGHLDGRGDNLRRETLLPGCPRNNSVPWFDPHLLLVDDVDARLDVGEGVGGGEDGLALVLLVQVPVRPPVQREGGAVDEAPQVVVLVEVSDAVLHFVGVEVRLHVGDLDEGLQAAAEADALGGRPRWIAGRHRLACHPPYWGPACTCPLGWSP